MNNLRIIRIKNIAHHHVSMEDIDDFESSVVDMSDLPVYYESKYIRKLIRPFIASLLNMITPKFLPSVFCISMGPTGVNRGFPFMFLALNNVLYLFDAWPDKYDLVSKIIRAYNIRLLFVSSKTSRDRLAVLLSDTDVRWCPEGCKPEIYKPYDFSAKDLDLIQIGRKYDRWHNMVVEEFGRKNISYLYEKVKGEIIFRTRAEFIDGLGRSKISVCFPKSVTNVKESGGISTMTTRYLQSMASKCLIVGMIPEEMKELFGYDPVIQADMTDPVGQICDILKNYSDYEQLIEKNYSECILKHSWKSRWESVYNIIRSYK